MPERAQDEITYGSTRIAYTIRRTATRRTIAITVNPDVSVTVAVPQGTRRSRIAEEVQRKASWIVKQQDWLRRHYPRRPRQFVSGESFLYLGRQYHLRVCRHPSLDDSTVSLTRGAFHVTVRLDLPDDEAASVVRRRLLQWYREHAHDYIVQTCRRTASRLGLQYQSVRILDMKTRWGSGGPDGQLRFNWRIVMAPRALLEYVVAHELCHLRHTTHSPAFWRSLSQLMPDYEDRRQRLAILGPTFDF
jgi:predicted metal-dependent hydrolase